MKYASCIVGLGNPGAAYRGTRHNLGFDTIDALLENEEEEKLSPGKLECELRSLAGLDGHRHLIIKPLTFMNLSGDAVAPLLRKHGITPELLLVVHDELDFAVGRVRVKFGGGSAGHNGIKSLVERIGTPDFYRLRIGIGRPASADAAQWVLSRPGPEERALLTEAVLAARKSIRLFMENPGVPPPAP